MCIQRYSHSILKKYLSPSCSQVLAVLLLLLFPGEASGLAVVVEPSRAELLVHDLATPHEQSPRRTAQRDPHGQLATGQPGRDDQPRKIHPSGARDHRDRLPEWPRAAHLRYTTVLRIMNDTSLADLPFPSSQTSLSLISVCIYSSIASSRIFIGAPLALIKRDVRSAAFFSARIRIRNFHA